MNLDLKGKLALVTGSTSGLGKIIAVTLAKEGADIIINGRNKGSVQKTMKEISGTYHVKTFACPVDARDGKAIKSFFKLGPIKARGSLDILINNVGHLEKFGHFTDLTDKNWLNCYELVCMSTVRFIREALPYLEKSGRGRIINISSLASHQPGNFNHHYVAAKAAVNALTKQLASSLGPMNILVNAICPSTLNGGSWERNVKDRAKRNKLSFEEAERIMKLEEFKKSPLGRMGTLENVANMVAYLASDKADFQTGHIYDIDGGIAKGL